MPNVGGVVHIHDRFQTEFHTELKAAYFNSTKDGRGYNLLHLNALYDLESQLYLDTVIQDGQEEHESRALVELVDRSELTEPVILIADRGYEAYNNMAHIEQKGWKYLIRVKDKQGILFTKPPPRFSHGGGYVGVVILMRLGIVRGGID